MMKGTLRIAGAIAFMSYCAATWLTGSVANHDPRVRLAAAVGADEPATTGSLASGAGAVRLDPCLLLKRP